ncbi:restriction endonuclease [Xinfangfangia sp. CPCC 101601]|uniref:Restriction endonuclease n=1 Tax=Pseudogemmobacter lacusdianii TaxID=3069608 RepID=A0ABU0W1Q8_9RHOB|nr:restriction endonuclease [Xinfangfangia sp. CPCC 101601]MDQ2067959.1 restriction endonuclease [Xinfangfangia sp. CPCC 101601]
MIRRTIREWQRIDYGLDNESLPQGQADRLAALARGSRFAGKSGEGVLEHGRKGLRARGVVGVLATSDCQLEILPKIEGAGEGPVSEARLRQRLIHMLSTVHELPIDTGAMTSLAWQRDTVLELMIRLFCNKLTDAVRIGMPRHYIEQEEDLTTLRGRLDVTRQFSVLAVSPQRLACRFDALSPDIALNQVMRATIAKLTRLAQAPDNQRSLRELGFVYADVAQVAPKALRWEQITLDRSNQRWRDLLALARLFLIERHQQTSGGAVEGHALLFEMNVLFEKFVARLLSQALAGSGLRVRAQTGQRDCLYEGDNGRFRTKPDILVWQDDRVVMVIDTKWKRIVPRINDPKQGVAQSDVYQLMAYAQLYNCQNVMLLYPHHADLPAEPLCQHFAIARQDAAERLSLATLDLTGPARAQKEALKQLVSAALSEAPKALAARD